MRYWLMKTEPDVFSFEDLIAKPKHTAPWDGVRNYQARNFMRDEFKLGDKIFIYHSSCTPPGVAGLAEVVKESYPDDSARDKKGPYYDEKTASKPENPWVCVNVMATHRLKNFVTLEEIRANKSLQTMAVIKRGQRLSIQPVTKKEWDTIVELAKPYAL